jgi:hypothetical protein
MTTTCRSSGLRSDAASAAPTGRPPSSVSSGARGVWQGVATGQGHLKVSTKPSPTLLCPAVGHPQDVRPAAIFHLFGHPTPYAYVFRCALVIGTFALASAIPHLGPFISLIGAFAFTGLAFLFPVLIDLLVRWR